MGKDAILRLGQLLQHAAARCYEGGQVGDGSALELLMFAVDVAGNLLASVQQGAQLAGEIRVGVSLGRRVIPQDAPSQGLAPGGVVSWSPVDRIASRVFAI